MFFPEDFVLVDKIEDNASTSLATAEEGIPEGKLGVDVGPRSAEKFDKIIRESKTIFLNGSCGVFECNIAREGSIRLVNSILEATRNGSVSVCGGGDTISLVNSIEGANKIISHLSTGGGASLELLEGKILPGIEYLSDIQINI